MKNYKETEKIIDNYWVNKNDKRQVAQSHHSLMNTLWKDEIFYSAENSKIYGEVKEIEEFGSPKQIFINTDSVSALFDNYCENKKICVLNFASYKYPGGGFINGSTAQEESLCHESTLYEVISDDKFKNYYDWNNQHLNNALYLDRAIYSPEIIFSRDKNIRADVLTCAAPNISSAYRYNNITEEENYNVLKHRMQFIANILNENNVEILIGGAFGCGVFGQSAKDVATIWKGLSYGKDLKLIVHAVIGGGENTVIFSEVFE